MGRGNFVGDWGIDLFGKSRRVIAGEHVSSETPSSTTVPPLPETSRQSCGRSPLRQDLISTVSLSASFHRVVSSRRTTRDHRRGLSGHGLFAINDVSRNRPVCAVAGCQRISYWCSGCPANGDVVHAIRRRCRRQSPSPSALVVVDGRDRTAVDHVARRAWSAALA